MAKLLCVKTSKSQQINTKCSIARERKAATVVLNIHCRAAYDRKENSKNEKDQVALQETITRDQ